MREFLEFVIRKLVEHPEDVIVTQGEDGDYVFFLLTMRPGDVGKVIGRNGHTINAIRNVLAAVAQRSGKKVAVDIVEPKPAPGDPGRRDLARPPDPAQGATPPSPFANPPGEPGAQASGA